MTEEVRKLLGGYATGTLTEDERTVLYQAALTDQTLFEALADEQALKDLLDSPAARATLLSAVENRPFSMAGVLRDWFDRPKSKALVATGAVLAVAIAVSQFWQLRESRVDIARRTDQPVAISPVPAPEPARTVSQAPAQPTKKPALRQASPAQMERAFPAEPALASPAPAVPPPAPAAPADTSVARVVASAETQLSYTVLLGDESGNFAPVPPDYRFSPGDRARLRLEANTRGTLLVKTPASNRTLFAGTISAETPVLVPGDIRFEDSGAQSIDVAFTPLPAESLNLSFAERAPEPANGVIGGVPGAAPRARLNSLNSRKQTQTAPALAVSPSPSNSVVFRIDLQRK